MSDARETAQKIASIVSPISRDISAALTENIFYALTAAVEAERARIVARLRRDAKECGPAGYTVLMQAANEIGAAAIDAAAGVIARGTK